MGWKNIGLALGKEFRSIRSSSDRRAAADAAGEASTMKLSLPISGASKVHLRDDELEEIDMVTVEIARLIIGERQPEDEEEAEEPPPRRKRRKKTVKKK